MLFMLLINFVFNTFYKGTSYLYPVFYKISGVSAAASCEGEFVLPDLPSESEELGRDGLTTPPEPEPFKTRRAGKRRLRHLSCPDYRESKSPRWSTRSKKAIVCSVPPTTANFPKKLSVLAAEVLVQLSQQTNSESGQGTSTRNLASSSSAIPSTFNQSTSETCREAEEVEVSSATSTPRSQSPNSPSSQQSITPSIPSTNLLPPLSSAAEQANEVSNSVTWDKEITQQLSFIRQQHEREERALDDNVKVTVSLDRQGNRSVTTKAVRTSIISESQRQEQIARYEASQQPPTCLPSSSPCQVLPLSTPPHEGSGVGTPESQRVWDVLPPSLRPAIWQQPYDVFHQGPRIRTLVGGGFVQQEPFLSPGQSSGRGSAASSQGSLEERLDRIDCVLGRVLELLAPRR